MTASPFINTQRRQACIAWLAATLLPAHGVAAQADRNSRSADAPLRPEWHSSFLVNLHHWLLDLARRPKALERMAWLQAPSAEQMARLEQAQAWYRQQFKGRDFTEDEMALQLLAQLSAAEDGRSSVEGLGLDPAIAQQLRVAAPIYAQCLWPRHQQANAAWLAALEPLRQRHGAALQARIARALGRPFPGTPWRVDLVAQTGDFRGAYTPDGPPRTVMPSERPDYQGHAALEMLFHEAAHLDVTSYVFERIPQLRQSLGLPERRDGLWHALQFYTVGELTRQQLASDGIDYVSYAERNDLYSGGPWDGRLPLLRQHWQPWLDGRVTMDEALTALVRACAAADAAPTQTGASKPPR